MEGRFEHFHQNAIKKQRIYGDIPATVQLTPAWLISTNVEVGYHHFLSRKNDYGRTTHRICLFLSLKGDQWLVPFSRLQDVNGPPNAKSRRFGNSATSAAPMGFVSVGFSYKFGVHVPLHHDEYTPQKVKPTTNSAKLQNPSLFHPFFPTGKYTFLQVVYSPLH